MQIRQKLTYQFISIVALILILSSIAIYFNSADYRRDDFYNRLLSKATNTAKLLIEVDEVDADLLKKIEKDNPSSLPEERISIYNFDDQLLYGTDNDNLFRANNELFNTIRLEHEVRFDVGDYEVLGFLFTGQYDRFVVLIGAIDIYGRKKLNNLRTVLFVVFGLSVVLVFVVGWIFSGRALRPISTVVEQVDNITINSLNLRVNEGNGRDEIAKLAATFNQMLDRLESAFKMQKDFIANASHELRTPLTTISGHFEVILMKEREASEYREAITSVLEDMNNLSSVSNRLLLLAQASSEMSDSNFNDIRIDDLIWQCRTDLMKRNNENNIKIDILETVDEDRKLTVFGNELLLKTAVTNLLDNASKYSGNKEVDVLITVEFDEVIIDFRDRGIGIDSPDLERIFEPFHRGKNAHSFKGHGIGLSLVQRIINLHNGNIRVTSVLGEGSTFSMSLPFITF